MATSAAASMFPLMEGYAREGEEEGQGEGAKKRTVPRLGIQKCRATVGV